MSGLKGFNIYLHTLPTKPLGEERKRLACVLISLGICSSFLPIVILDPPVLNRTEWSALNVASKVYEGKLPVPGSSFDLELIAIAMIYLLMPFALIALYRPGPPKALKVICGMGAILDVVFRRGPYGMDTFGLGTGYFAPGHMRAGPAWWILPWIMPALLAICFAKNLDRQAGDQEKDVS